jgi:branched-chain amino acid aminotransferase
MSELLSMTKNAKDPITGFENWAVEKTTKSRLQEVDFNNLPFGHVFSDHMLVADYENGAWREVKIIPFGDLSLSPSNMTIHYGQSIFEGIKGYKNRQGEVFIFRPDKNYDRFLRSAERMAMPAVPREVFLDGMIQLVGLDKDWTPTKEGSSLYIRPVMFAMDDTIGVKPGKKYKFIIMTSPAGPYYNKPLKLYVEDYYVRACEGGVGAAKTAGNYAASLYPTEQVIKKGFDQILWTDAKEHKYLQECGTMNLFVVIDGKTLTAGLDEGTILDGVTRDSVIQILRGQGYPLEERPISIEEVVDAYKKGTLQEIFGSGTAANIIYISELQYNNQTITLKPQSEWRIAPMLLKELNGLHHGDIEDTRDWMWKAG